MRPSIGSYISKRRKRLFFFENCNFTRAVQSLNLAMCFTWFARNLNFSLAYLAEKLGPHGR